MLKYLGSLLSSVLVAGLLALPTFHSSAAEVVELGKISPNGPYRIWSSINAGLVELAYHKGGEALKSQVSAMSPVVALGKKPGHVLAQGDIFRALLDANLESPTAIYKDPLGRDITPGVVYVNATNMLDGLFVNIVAEAKGNADGLGDIYINEAVEGKTPSDVYALVYLATRRMQLISE